MPMQSTSSVSPPQDSAIPPMPSKSSKISQPQIRTTPNLLLFWETFDPVGRLSPTNSRLVPLRKNVPLFPSKKNAKVDVQISGQKMVFIYRSGNTRSA